MKLLKSLGTIFTIALLIFSISIPVLAAAPIPGTITMKDTAGNTKTSSTYEAYKIVEWNMSKVDNKVIYTDMKLNAVYKNAIVSTLGEPLTGISTDAEILKAISALSETSNVKIADLAIALSQVPRTADYTANNGLFINLPYGYYLIMETANNANDGTVLSKPILVSVPDRTAGNPDVSVTVKTSTATVEKNIVVAAGDVKAAEKKIGDTVNFKLTATIPTYSANATNITYFVTDTLSKGLTFDSNSVLVKNANGNIVPAANYTVDAAAPDTNGNTVVKINFIYANIKDLGQLTITYNAKLNNKSSIGITGNPNSVTLTYSNKPGTGGTVYTTPPKHTIVYTTGIQLTKVDGSSADNAKLAGAVFGIYSDLACKNPVGYYTYVMTTDATGTHVTTVLKEGSTVDNIVTGNDGIAYFTGLLAGDYYIKEIKAPAGYDLLKEPIHVKITVQLPQSI
ncbi:MAG: SpaH/EbpB family LPXTG-anchored major pilin, partial [Clostridiales bacterium]